LVGNTVWRIKRRPVWNMLAAKKAPPCLSLKARRGAEALTGHRISDPAVQIIGYAVSKAVPGTRW
jgi:hypothetical protein